MSNRLRRTLAIICIVCMLSASSAFAEGEQERDDGLVEIPLYVDGILFDRGYMIDETTYVSLRSFCEAFLEDAVISWDEDTQTATVETDSLLLTITVSEKYLTANGRILYLEDGIYNIYGTVVVPLRELAKVFNIGIEWDEECWDVTLGVEEVSVMTGGEGFYDEDDLYWLSRIISAESGNQSLEGKIAVGNVVLNRVEEPTCPDTIYDVIFDMENGVQFMPALLGSVYNSPNAESELAAKIALEGYNVAEDSLFFVNPATCDPDVLSWLYGSRPFVAAIGEHYFFS